MSYNQSKKIVIIGNGMAAQKFIEELTALDKERRFAITVVTQGATPQCDWLHLSTKTPSDRSGFSQDIADRRTRTILLQKNFRINRNGKRIETDEVGVIPYDVLVMATGSSPTVPDIEGAELKGVYIYRSPKDLPTIACVASHAKKATVVGGGLLSVNAARVCAESGVVTTLLASDDHLLPRQLADKSNILNRYMESIGVHIRTDAKPKCFLGNERLTCVRLIGDAMIPADLAIVCADIRPNDQLAVAAGLPVVESGGIIVDSHLRTADPNIFAIGECASFGGMVCGLVSPGFTMAASLAKTFSGEQRPFENPDLVTKLRRLGIDAATMTRDQRPPLAKTLANSNTQLFHTP